MRPVRALIRPADKYTIRDQTAGGGLSPRDALQLPPRYRSVKSILVHELVRLPQQQPAQPEDGQIQFRFPHEHGHFDTDHATATSGESGTPAWTNWHS